MYDYSYVTYCFAFVVILIWHSVPGVPGTLATMVASLLRYVMRKIRKELLGDLA